METVPQIEALLAHAEWVRALARSLVADPAHAEDVAQEAWLAALRSPPADASNPRGWLAVVVRNAARKLGRGEARRAQRELASARGEALPSAAELVEAAALQRELADLVLELDEPYRRTVLLRFHHGLEVAEIAARAGEPVTTVRSRLQRALERLREKLDRRHGEREAWCAALMPLARGPLPKAAAAPGAVAGSAWLLLGKPALALVLAAGAAVLWMRTRDDAGSAPLPVRPSGERVAAPESPAAPAQEPTRTALEQNVSAASQGSGAAAQAAVAVGVAEGRCVDADGRALAGVELVWMDPEAVRVDGEWVSFGNFGILATEEDRASYRAWPELLEQRIAEYGDRIGAREALRGEPIPRPRTVTGTDGTFSLEVTGTEGTLETTRSDLVAIGIVQSAKDALQQLVVVPCRQIGGEVVDEQGIPIEGAKVECSAFVDNLPFASTDARTSSYGTQEQVTTDVAGRFRLARAPYLRGKSFVVRVPDREPVSVELPAESRDDLRVVVPRRDPARDRSPHLRGRVVDGDGAPVEDAEVRYGQDSVRSDAAGAFDLRLTCGLEDTRALTANKAGLRPTSIANLGAEAYARLSSAVGSSRVDLQACKLEYSIVSPK